MKAPVAGRARDTERRIRNSERKISRRVCEVAELEQLYRFLTELVSLGGCLIRGHMN